jgi:gliding motility-associated-like protein
MEPMEKFKKKLKSWHLLILSLTAGFTSNNGIAQGQLPECTAEVPFFNIDLSASPDSSFTTPEIIRKTGCCGVNNEYVAFFVKLHPDVAMFEIEVEPTYADPGGAGNYTIISGGDLSNSGTCGTQIPGGGPICITGSGPHKIVYSKAGSNKIKYIFRQIPKPIYPLSQPARLGCSLPLPIYGLNSISITAISKSSNLSASLATCNTYLNCLNCANPIFQPGANATYPYSITYQVSGTPKASICGTYPASGTFTITVYDELNIAVTPNPATFCSGGSGVQLNATSTGGFGGYNYIWLNSSGDTVSTSASYFATAEGTYTAQVKDALVTSTCAPEFISVPVIISSPPVVNAGSDQWVCATNPQVSLNGTSSTGSGVWSNGTGTFNPGNNSLITTYMPSASEINAGFAKLILTSSGTGSGCTNSKDTLFIYYSDTIKVNLSYTPIGCYNGTTIINSAVNGGTAPYTYNWSNGTFGTSINASAGVYSLYITDSEGCEGSKTIALTQPNPLTSTISSTLDFGTCNGTASAVAIGGTPPYSYEWSNGTIGSTVNNLCTGIETVVITDANNCENAQSVVINNVTCASFNASIGTVNHVSCHGGNDGMAVATSVGGFGTITYTWSTNPIQNSSTANNLSSGNYAVLATDQNGCQDFANITILQPTALTNSMSHTDVSTIGGNDGTATANPLGGTPGYTYLWQPTSQTNQTATNLTSAVGGSIYYVTIKDTENCIKTDSVVINQPPCDNFLVGINTQNTSCNGLNNGSAYIVIADGTAPYSINWSNGASNVNAINNLSAGNYSVSITDAANCSTFQTFTITQPDQLQLGLVPTNVTCYGDNNGTIDLTVSGGTYPFTYNWNIGTSPLANHEDIINLSPGTYSVTVEDINGCRSTSSVGITQPAQLNSSYTYTDNPCFNNQLGSINMTPSGGTVPYIYSWTGPNGFSSNTQDIANLESGLYNFTIADNNNCIKGPIQVYINEPDTLIVTSQMTQQVSCLGQSNGAANTTVTGGTAQYSYLWTGPNSYNSIGANLLNVPAGLYNVSVTDGKNCTAQTQVQISTILDTISPVISCLGNQIANTSSISCSYKVNGTSWDATATDNCVVSSVTYSLSGATIGTGTTLNNVNFNEGETTVLWLATDGLGNKDSCSFTVTIEDNTLPVISSCGVNNSDTVNTNSGVCHYLNIGTNWDPTVSDNCGISEVTYVLSGATSGTGTSLNNVIFNKGMTTVIWTVEDVNGNIQTCSYSIHVIDNEPPSLVNCPNNVTSPTGIGLCGNTVNWSLPIPTDNCAASMTSNFNPGQYFNVGSTIVTYTATDESGNSSTCSFQVNVQDLENPIATIPNNISSCNPFVTFNSPSATDNCGIQSINQISGLPSGSNFPIGTTTNTFEVIDIHGNSTLASFHVTIHPTPTLSVAAQQISCFGLNNGELDLTVTNGTSPYSYNWSNGALSEDISNLSPGTYGVNVVDFYGCSSSSSSIITQPSLIVVQSINQNVSCYGGNNGAIDVTVSGGISPYLFSWSNGDTTEDLTNLNEGNYSLLITDNNGCTAGLVQTIDEPNPITILASTSNATCTANNGSIRIVVTGGTAPYNYEWSNGSNTMNLVGVASGNYLLTITDHNNCVLQYTGLIASTDNLSSEINIQDARCYGESSGEAEANILIGNPPYSFNWSTGDSTQGVSGLMAGDYEVSITDIYGCSTTETFTINQPDSLFIELMGSVYNANYNISSNGGSDGYINSQVYGGTEPYTYTWSTGDTTSNIAYLPSGMYSLIVQDNNGCVVTAMYRLLEPGILEMPSGFSPNGDLSNEFFVVHGLDAYPENNLTIYNRWGNIVYEKGNYKNDWNGENNNGEELPDATYFALLTVYGKEKITLKGYVDLRR